MELHDELPFELLPTQGGRGSWLDEAATLRESPGKWGKIHTFTSESSAKAKQRASNLISGINRKELKAFRTNGRWETARNIIGDGTTVEVWVRWIDTTEPAPKVVQVPRKTRAKRPD